MKPIFNAKNGMMALFMTAGLAITATSCKKDASTASATPAVTVDDAADAVTEAVTPESAGMVAQTQTAVIIVNTSNLDCGQERDTAFGGQNSSGAAVTYSYAFSSSRLLACNNGIPQQFTYAFSGKTSYDAPRISSADSSQAQFSVTGLQAGANQYVFNESYVRSGSETSKVRNKQSFASKITIQTSDLTVNKSTGLIVSGTASVSISGSASGGASFSYSGTITFLGNKQATLVLGNGNTYSIIWS